MKDKPRIYKIPVCRRHENVECHECYDRYMRRGEFVTFRPTHGNDYDRFYKVIKLVKK